MISCNRAKPVMNLVNKGKDFERGENEGGE